MMSHASIDAKGASFTSFNQIKRKKQVITRGWLRKLSDFFVAAAVFPSPVVAKNRGNKAAASPPIVREKSIVKANDCVKY